MTTKRDRATHTCFACGECIENEKPLQIEDTDGTMWHCHSKDECYKEPTPGQKKREEET